MFRNLWFELEKASNDFDWYYGVVDEELESYETILHFYKIDTHDDFYRLKILEDFTRGWEISKTLILDFSLEKILCGP